MGRKLKSPEICTICKNPIPARERSTRRTTCKKCSRERRKEQVRNHQATKKALQRKITRLEKNIAFLREYANRDNWGFNLTKTARKLNVSSSTLFEFVKREKKLYGGDDDV